MASELRVNTLKDASGNNSIGLSYVAEGTNKLWVNLNGTTVDSTADLTGVRNSFATASVVDNGTGDHTINFTNAMNDLFFKVANGEIDNKKIKTFANDD